MSRIDTTWAKKIPLSEVWLTPEEVATLKRLLGRKWILPGEEGYERVGWWPNSKPSSAAHIYEENK
jgi:hypothetical protein